MNPSKIFGWILLLAGILIIAGTLYSSFNIFTGKSKAPEIFNIPEVKKAEKALGIQGKIPTNPEDIQKTLENLMGEQLKNLLPPEAIPNILNLTIWSILAGLLIFGGGQIAGLGIKLIKT